MPHCYSKSRLMELLFKNQKAPTEDYSLVGQKVLWEALVQPPDQSRPVSTARFDQLWLCIAESQKNL